MEPKPEELLSALRDAEEFISVTLSNESLTHETENKRRQLETKLKNLINNTNAGKDAALPGLQSPKSSPNVFEEENDGEDLYDDVGTDSIEVKDERRDDSPMPSHSKIRIDGVTKETSDNISQESYEDMSSKNIAHEEEMYDDTVNLAQEDNEEAPKEDGVADSEVENYEIAEPNIASTNITEEDDGLYDGVDTMENEDKMDNKKVAGSFEQQKRSTAHELGMLTNPVKAADVEEIIYKGYLDKHRKRGKIYIGGKWQKRYCIVRSFVMYYYVNQNSDKQKGTIILPGYTVAVNKSKSNREFILMRDQDRSYIFQAESKEEMDKWINAIQKAANTKISNRQSEILDDLRSKIPDGEEDASSLCYDDVSEKSKNGSLNSAQNGEGECYDDVSGNEDSGSGIVDYEIPQVESSSEEKAGLLKEEPLIQDDIYEMPEDESEEQSVPPQPLRPAMIAQLPLPPPDIPPTSVEEEELYDDVGIDIPSEQEVVPQAQAKPQIPERNIPLPVPPSDTGRASPAMQRPALPSPPREPKQAAGKPSIPPRRRGSLPPEPGKDSPPSSPGKSLPPPPPPEEETIPDKAPPPPPPEEETSNIDLPPPPQEEETEAQVIDYSCIYQALWDCQPDADDELEFKRGDLIYIYEKPHSDWWIGSKYNPQGYETRLIPRNYLTEAYD